MTRDIRPMSRKQQDILYNQFGYNVAQGDMSSSEAFDLIGKLTAEKHAHNKEIANQARTADLHHLASKAVSWSYESGANANARCPMKGCTSKHNGFYVNRYENVGGCRCCEWEKNGEGGGPIGFICALEGVDWIEAAEIITNDSFAPERAPIGIKNMNDNPYPSKEWQSRCLRGLELAQSRLTRPGDFAMSYLKSRGITIETAQAFGCGSGTMKDGPHSGATCVIFPYWRVLELVGVNRRVTSATAHDKYRFVKGSRKTGFFSHFTGESQYENYQWWLVEGEINAMSIAQTLKELGMSGSVRSVSSETDVKRVAADIAKKTPQTIVWVDKDELAREIWETHQLTTIWSRDGDANDLLLKHKLKQFLTPYLTAGNIFAWSNSDQQEEKKNETEEKHERQSVFAGA